MSSRRRLLAGLLVAVTGCGESADTAGPQPPVATTISLSATVVSLAALSDTHQLTASVRDQNGADMPGAPVTWASSEPQFAGVSAAGLVSAVANGSSTITAASGAASATATVTVEQVPATIELTPMSLALAGPGDTATVAATVLDAGGDAIESGDVTWSSGDEAVATVSSTGLVTAVATGDATVTAEASATEPVTEELPVSVEDGVFSGPEGGQVSVADDVATLDFPPGAVTEPVFITAQPATGLPPQSEPVPGTAFDFGPDGLVFDEPVTLTIVYDPEDVPRGAVEEELRLHKLSGSGWELVDGGTVDVGEHAVTGVIDGFSVYAAVQMLGVATTSLPTGIVGVDYGTETLAASGGGGAYTWALGSGSGPLPDGLSLSATGEVTGTPTTPGTSTFTVEVGDGTHTAEAELSIEVQPLLLVTTSALPDAEQDEDYGTQTLGATGGDGNYSWALAEGSGPLPPGLDLAANGDITGTPTQAGLWSFTVEVTSGDGQTAQAALSVTVDGDLAVLEDGVPLFGLSAPEGSATYYAFSVPPDAPQLEVSMAGGTGDADLYVREGALPTTDDYDCASFSETNEETCTLPDPGAGDWFVMVDAFAAYSGVTLVATANAALNLWVDVVHLNQGNQSPAGDAGAVADRPGLLRVVVRANQSNNAAPDVRVRLYDGMSLIREETVPSPQGGVPLAPSLDDVDDTWNVPLPADEVVAGLTVEVMVDPDDAIAESDEGDNAWPPGGGDGPLDVQEVPPLDIVFIPVEATVQGTTGAINVGNIDNFLDATWRWIPTGSITTDVHATFSTDEDLSTDDGWNTLLSDIQALRSVEAAGTDTYYHGIIGDSPDVLYGGLGYVPGSPGSSFRSAVSYDRMPFAPATVAHELGHNFGREHAPCGPVGNADPDYPYPNAEIGFPGYDIIDGGLVPSSLPDYMSYCGPPDWTSDYTFGEIREWRLADPLAPAAGSPAGSASSGLLLWGRIHAGGVTLNPAFALEAFPVLPTRGGANTLRGLAADGSVVFDVTFQGARVAEGGDPDERHFSFFVPLAPEELGAVDRITLTTPRGVATVGPSGPWPPTLAAAAGPEVTVSPAGAGRVNLRWDASRYPMVLLRDETTGQVLSFARGGDAVAAVGSIGMDRLQVHVSDGARSRLGAKR